jgi:hypothetical protein
LVGKETIGQAREQAFTGPYRERGGWWIGRENVYTFPASHVSRFGREWWERGRDLGGCVLSIAIVPGVIDEDVFERVIHGLRVSMNEVA